MSVASFLVTCLEEQASLLNDQIKRAKAMAKMEGAVIPTEKTKGRKKREKADPNKPKKALTAYQLYFMENQGPYKTSHPTITPRDVMAEIGKQWTTLSADGKAAYLNAAEEAKKVYDAQMQAYNLTLEKPLENPTIVGVPADSSSSSSSSDSSSDSSDSESDDEVVVQKPVVPTVVTKTKPAKKVPIVSAPTVADTPAPVSKSKKAKHVFATTPAAIVPQALATPAVFVATSAADTSEKKKKKKKREREE